MPTSQSSSASNQAFSPLPSDALQTYPIVVDGQSYTLYPVIASQRHQALSLLLTGWPSSAEPAVEHFMGLVRARSIDLSRFWLVSEPSASASGPAASPPPAGQPLLAILIIPAPGRTGIVMVTPLVRRREAFVAGQALQAIFQHHGAQGLVIVQALLDPAQTYEKLAYLEGGLAELAQLQYMQRPLRYIKPIPLPEGFSLHTWPMNPPEDNKARSQEDTRPLFTQALLDSYIDTLDCPGLVGLRKIDDIITGHQGYHPFWPESWLVLCRGQEPCGVLLMNHLTDLHAMELAYLGLSPSVRGQGLGRTLLNYGLNHAWGSGAKQMLLAVDERNTPAMKLYTSMRFTPTARKLAMIRACPET